MSVHLLELNYFSSFRGQGIVGPNKSMETASTHPKPPRISVLIPCYQQARFLPEALDSVLCQDFHDLEVIASDDASPDNTFPILQDYAQRDSRIRIFRQPSNLGMVKNWNFCLRQARGEAVKLMGGDDHLDRADCLSRQWQSLQTPGVALAACARRIINESSVKIETLVNLPSGVYSQDKIIPKILEHQDNLIGEPVCCLFHRKDATRGFHPEYLQNTDIEMWLHLLQRGGLACDSEPLVSFRRHLHQASQQNWISGLALEEHCLLMLRYALDNHVPSATKFHVLFRAKESLVYAKSEKIREAANILTSHFSPIEMAKQKALHHIWRNLTRWKRSISKRMLSKKHLMPNR
jgi:glycosyltransferase involved in cell wall biosynthesis